jgi:hypothetical protein
MKNKLFISALCCVMFAYSNAQNNVGIGITTPNPKAILELHSTDKGILIPRLTAAERVAIAPSVTETSLLVFDVDSNLFTTGMALSVWAFCNQQAVIIFLWFLIRQPTPCL